MNITLKKIILIIYCLLLVSIPIYSLDTIICYTGTYEAETSIGFIQNSDFNNEYVAKLGTLTIYCNRKLGNINGTDNDSSYIRALYFRDSNSNNTAKLICTTDSSISFNASLATILTDKNNYSYSPVRIDQVQNVVGVYDTYKHILPTSLLSGTPLYSSKGNSIKLLCTIDFYRI